MALWELSAVELQTLIAQREVSAVEVVTDFLERIERGEPEGQRNRHARAGTRPR